MSHNIPVNTRVAINKPFASYDRATAIVTGHTWREGRPAYRVTLDRSVGDIGSVVLIGDHLTILPGPDAENPGEPA